MKIQTAARIWLAKREAQMRRLIIAATKIQSNWRVAHAKMKLRDLRIKRSD